MHFEFDGRCHDDAPYDVVIAGSGPAGMSVALKLAKNGKRVALLEGGGEVYSQTSQDVYKGTMLGNDMGMEFTRLRYLGGTSNHWAGRCRPFEAIDFEERSSVYQLPGWPISKAEVDRYLSEAMEILDLPSDKFVQNDFSPNLPPNFEPDRALLSPPTRFGAKYLEELKQSELIDLYTNANVVEVRLDESKQRFLGFRVKNFEGKECLVKAQNGVVAMGALENARLLLHSDEQVGGGLGNAGDMVGRCFMEHFMVRLGEFIPTSPEWSDTSTMSYFNTSLQAREKRIGLSNATLSVGESAKIDGHYLAIKKPMVNLACRFGFEESLKKVIGFRCPGKGLVSTLTEQEPNKSSRVYLNEERDSLGVRRLSVDWQLSEFDKRTLRTLAKDLAASLAEHDIARMQLPDYILDDSLEIPVRPHCHHLGTTRMALDVATGVVDRNCEVFGAKNLFVAGSSVFSRGGGNNPTMPLIQLALRLADHLSEKDAGV